MSIKFTYRVDCRSTTTVLYLCRAIVCSLNKTDFSRYPPPSVNLEGSFDRLSRMNKYAILGVKYLWEGNGTRINPESRAVSCQRSELESPS